MTWLLDLIEEHRAAVQYDLLNHGRSIHALGTSDLWWDEALVILTKQAPSSSAVHRALYPDEPLTEVQQLHVVVDRLEMSMVMLGQMMVVLRYPPEMDIPSHLLPRSFADLIEQPKRERPLLSIEEVNARMALIGGEAWASAS